MSNAYRYVNEERAIEMERARDLAQDENHYLRQRVTELVAEVERLRVALQDITGGPPSGEGCTEPACCYCVGWYEEVADKALAGSCIRARGEGGE